MTVYLLDTNVFISAKRSHYRFGTFPSFWKLLHAQGTATHRIETLEIVRDEINNQKDDLTSWASTCPASMFVSQQDPDTAVAAARVSAWVNAHPGYMPAAIAEFLNIADYWLVAHALAHGHKVVTHEASNPNSKKRVLIPDACNAFNVKWCTPWVMLEEMGVQF